jgi:hypothetical protein
VTSALRQAVDPQGTGGADIETVEVSQALAAALEQAEVNAWLDLYEAAPADFAERFGLSVTRKGDLVATLSTAIPFIHFNAVMNLGMVDGVGEAELDELLALYRDAGIKRPWFYHNPHCVPENLPALYESRGLKAQGGWDRIFRDGGAPVQPSAEAVVERVEAKTAGEWAAFIDGMYRLPTSPWLIALAGRPGWSHYTLRREGRIVAVRSMFMDEQAMVWMGIEAPVPGIMAPSFEDDAAIVAVMVADAIAAGAAGFVADIEAPLPEGRGPAYRNFARLGFRRAYFRGHYGF